MEVHTTRKRSRRFVKSWNSALQSLTVISPRSRWTPLDPFSRRPAQTVFFLPYILCMYVRKFWADVRKEKMASVNYFMHASCSLYSQLALTSWDHSLVWCCVCKSVMHAARSSTLLRGCTLRAKSCNHSCRSALHTSNVYKPCVDLLLRQGFTVNTCRSMCCGKASQWTPVDLCAAARLHSEHL